jgi:hypothetical protein
MNIGTLSIEESKSYRAAVCMVGQEDARKLLERNTFNRKPSESCIQKYLREMQAGEWVATASGIGFDEEGVLTDGQNRLEAISRYTSKVPLLIVTGLPKMARAKVDRHNKRRIQSSLFLAGITKTEDKYGIQVAVFLASVTAGRAGSGGIADCDIAAAYEAHQSSISAVCAGLLHNLKGVGQVGFKSAIVLAHEIHGNKAIEFAKLVQSDLHTRHDDPAFRLRKTLLGEGSGKTPGSGGDRQSWSFYRTIYAFNAWIQGRRINMVLPGREIVDA